LQDKNVKPETMAAAQAHYAEHQAYHWMTQAAHAMGLPMLPVNLQAEPGEPMAMQMRPEVELELSQRAAMAVNKLMPPKEDPEMAEVKGKLAIEDARMKGQLKIKAAESQARMRLERAEAMYKLALQREVAFAELSMKREQGILGLQQQGKADDAKREQDTLSADKDRVVKERQSAEKELEAAIRALADGLDVVAGMAEKALGQGGASGQQFH
jgi:hypothetical protein